MNDRTLRSPMKLAHILRSRLFVRYLLLIVLSNCALLVCFSALEIATLRSEIETRAALLLAERARGAATRIQEHFAGIENQLGAVAGMPWAQLTDADREFEYRRLQRIVPSLMEIRYLDAERRSWIRTSQLGRNAIGTDLEADSAIPRARAQGAVYGKAIIRDGIDPYAWLVVKEAKGETAALVNMKFIAEYVEQLRFDRTGAAFVVDGGGFLIAHPDIRLTLRHMNIAKFPDIARAAAEGGATRTATGRSFLGEDAQFAVSPIGDTGWLAFVQQSRNELMEPVREAVFRAILIAAAGIFSAFLIALLLARHLAAPIIQLRDAARRIGTGDLEARVSLRSTDEVEGLAAEFNRMAARVRDSYAQLEAKVAERTRELALKKEEADNANVAKTRFLAAASHDLRQPMHAISLLMGILEERVRQADIRPLIEKVNISVNTMERLFGSLLDISKLDAGAVRPQVVDVSIAGLLDLAEAHHGPVAREKGLAFKVHRSDAVVRSDPALLERILNNLVSNAVRYTANGRVVVGCRRHHDSIRILVLDTGPGIPMEHRTDIFSEFFQLRTSDRAQGEGLGLGLSIVKRSADLLGHRLIVESWPGRGSMFGIELPAAPHVQRLEDTPAEQREEAVTLRGAFVAVVDDRADNRYATESLFAQWGCITIGAASADDLLDRLASHLRVPDLLVTDLRLGAPDSGLDVIARVRAVLEARIPALIVTGEVSLVEPRPDAVAVLFKPVSASVLRHAAVAALSLATLRQPPRT